MADKEVQQRRRYPGENAEERLERRRQQARERMRLRRANLNAEQLNMQRQLNRQKIDNQRANETADEANARRQNERLRINEHRANETADEANARRQNNRLRINEHRANETADEASARLQNERLRINEHRANETADEANARLQNERLRINEHRANETADEANARRARDLENHNRVNRAQNALNAARNNADNLLPETHSLGEFNVLCPHCGALKFQKENVFKCCHSGKVNIPNYSPYPDEIHFLLTSNCNLGRNFRKHIRVYNNLLSFASMAADIRPPPGNGPPCFRICGQIHHRYGVLHPGDNEQPQYNQLYIVEARNALDVRMSNPSSADCNRDVMQTLQTVLSAINPYAAAFRNMAAVEEEENQRAVAQNRQPAVVTMIMREGSDRRRDNPPVNDEVAAIFVANDGAPPASRDIIIYPRNAPLRRIPYTSSNIDPMCYPILFPTGDPGWNWSMPHVQEHATERRNHVTQLQYYYYRIAIRREFSALHLAGKLFQQFVVDSYIKVEGTRLDFIRNNQTQLRADTYNGLIEHLNDVAREHNVRAGRVVVLPSTFAGSPRNMHQNFLDAMALVAKLGKPDLFLTFTCNPKWPEIVANLLPGQTASDRPDLVARVFKLKLNCLKEDLKKGVLGVILAHVDVIEFQKRGLPHCHMLLHLSNEHKLRNSDDIDTLISACIPDRETEPELYSIVSSTMVHGPCGLLSNNSPCMVNGACSKHYPKEFNNGTVLNVNGYPLYHRPDDGRTVTVKGVQLDSRHIVPYNPYLSKKYMAHINLEACISIKSVKYIYKYLYKGYDTAHVEINERIHHDEVKTFIDARYVSAPEAAWRLFAYSMHTSSHSIIRLPLHLPDNQRVYFREGEEANAVDRAEQHNTMLTAWFVLNQNDATAREYTYTDIPYYFVFNKKDKMWTRRQRGAGKIISRMYNASIKEGERFFLRVLLLHIPGATSFHYLKTYEGNILGSFREACIARGLLDDDTMWTRTLEETIRIATPNKIRLVFTFILIHGEPNSPLELWRTYRMSMMEDFLRQMNEARAEQSALGCLQTLLQQFGKSLSDFDLPELEEIPVQEVPNADEMRQEAINIRNQLNPEQMVAADFILNALENNHDGNNIFFLDGPGGTGKTFTYNYIVREVLSRNMSVSTCAWTGIAATLLYKGKTVHSLFKLPVPVVDGSTCNIKPNSNHAAFLKRQHIIIFDEASMIPKHAIEAIDRMFRDICNVNTPFGGKVILLGGDFRQTLPVVRRARPAQIVEVCLKSSYIWPSVRVFHLRTNMRAGLNEQVFANWLLDLGNGRIPLKVNDPFKDCIKIPEECVTQPKDDIIDEIFGDNDANAFPSRVILTPTNDAALQLNDKILDKLAGEAITFFSIDSVVSDEQEEAGMYPLEFLNSITPSGMPQHKLKLKPGCIVMLLRNLSLQNGLCNGTRLRVHSIRENVIDCEIITGVATGNRVLIPRVSLSPSDTNLPFQLKRVQFPLRLSYAMTINKSQGQTFEKVGMYLRRPCFSHGQLYVAFSRARALQHVKVKVYPSLLQGYQRRLCFTKNVVFRQIL